MNSLATFSEKTLIEFTILFNKNELFRMMKDKELAEKQIERFIKCLKEHIVSSYKLFPVEQENYEYTIEIVYCGQPEKINIISSAYHSIVDYFPDIIELMENYPKQVDFDKAITQFLFSKKLFQSFADQDAPEIARPKI